MIVKEPLFLLIPVKLMKVEYFPVNHSVWDFNVLAIGLLMVTSTLWSSIGEHTWTTNVLYIHK